MKFNLIYHIYPPKGNQTWKDNIDRLKHYIHIFNNKKIVNIATGEGLAPPEEIFGYFNDPSIRFIETPNSPDLGEVVAFEKLLKKVFSLDPGESTFYAHTKGSSRGKQRCAWPIQMWYEHMYKYNLENPQKIEKILSKAPCCGCLKENGNWDHYNPAPEANFPFSNWYYAGTFFWFNHADLFTKDWRSIERNRWGVEMYLSKFFSGEDAACVFFNGPENIYFNPNKRTFWWFAMLPCNKIRNFEKYVLTSKKWCDFLIKKILKYMLMSKKKK